MEAGLGFDVHAARLAGTAADWGVGRVVYRGGFWRPDPVQAAPDRLPGQAVPVL